MNIATVVIWYNPQNIANAVSNIQSYCENLKKVYIVDNSSVSNEKLAAEIPNSVYIPNLKNIGIAAAQNIGCKKAKAAGFDWAMTMDQDSYFDNSQLQKYFALCTQYYKSNNNNQSFSLALLDSAREKILPVTVLLKRRLKSFLKNCLHVDVSKPVLMPDVEHLQRVFASGNIINLEMWEKIGRFDEKLFIDEVDFDFCLRAVLNGYVITRFNSVYLNHTLGTMKKTLFQKCSYHNDFRLYYIIRNKFIEYKRYNKILRLQYNYKKEIFQYFKDYCIFDLKAPKHFIVFARAYLDYRKFIKTDETYRKLNGDSLTGK